MNQSVQTTVYCKAHPDWKTGELNRLEITARKEGVLVTFTVINNSKELSDLLSKMESRGHDLYMDGDSLGLSIFRDWEEEFMLQEVSL